MCESQQTPRLYAPSLAKSLYGVFPGPVGQCISVKGSQGIPGPRGDRGREGLPGKSGPRGIKGMKGQQGLVGMKGEEGIAGMKGEQGAVGMKGQRGIAGMKGRKGDKGEKGESAKASQASLVPQTTWKQCVWNSYSGPDNGKIKVQETLLVGIIVSNLKSVVYLDEDQENLFLAFYSNN